MMKTRTNKRRRGAVCLSLLLALLTLLLLPSYARAEGSVDLTEHGGKRPYIEWRGDNVTDAYYSTSGTGRVMRQQVIKAYIGVGETVYFGGSFTTAEYIDSTKQKDIGVKAPSGTVTYYDVADVINGKGRIQTRAMELAGPKQLGNAAGYDAHSFTATEAGVYEFRFYTSGNTTASAVVDADADWVNNQQRHGIAAWDITVTDAAGARIPGRTYANFLVLNPGNQEEPINSVVYVLTADGYIYETNFNGIEPSGFLFFANNRGLINETTDTSFYHSTLFSNNHMTGIQGNVGFVPPLSDVQTGKDVTFRIFFNRPDADALKFFQLEEPILPAEPKDFVFNAGSSTGVGVGGDFSFVSTAGSSYQIKLEFGADPNNVVYLSDYCPVGANTVHWDGRDRYGVPAPVGTYTATLTIKGGEYHFPFADVERSQKGIHIGMINVPASADPGFNPNLVYYDHSNITVNGTNLEFTTRSDNTDPRFAGSLTQLGGIDSSLNGGVGNAMRFVGNSTSRFGDEKLFDIWTYYTAKHNTVTTPVRVADPATLGELTIRKEVTGPGADLTKPFTFAVAFAGGGTYPYTGSKTGLIKSGESIELMHGESVTIHDVPENETYTVTEKDANQLGYVTSATGDTGTITHAAVSRAMFINAYAAAVTPEADIPKTGDGSQPMLYLIVFITACVVLIVIRLSSARKTDGRIGTLSKTQGEGTGNHDADTNQ